MNINPDTLGVQVETPGQQPISSKRLLAAARSGQRSGRNDDVLRPGQYRSPPLCCLGSICVHVVCMRVHVCVRACVRVCVCVCV